MRLLGGRKAAATTADETRERTDTDEETVFSPEEEKRTTEFRNDYCPYSFKEGRNSEYCNIRLLDSLKKGTGDYPPRMDFIFDSEAESKIAKKLLIEAVSRPDLRPPVVSVKYNGGSYSDVEHILTPLLTKENSAVQELELVFNRWTSRKSLTTALAPALRHPNCRVELISFDGNSSHLTTAFLSFVRTVIEGGCSRVSAIRLQSLLLLSPRVVWSLCSLLDYCPNGTTSPKITGLHIFGDAVYPGTVGGQILYRYVLTPARLRRLESFRFSTSAWKRRFKFINSVWSRGQATLLARNLSIALQQKDNKLRELALSGFGEFTSELVHALRHENCNLRRLVVRDRREIPTGLMEAVAVSLNSRNCNLRHLEYEGPDLQTKEILRAITRAIRGGARLKTLKLRSDCMQLSPGLGRDLIIAMKETPNSIRSLRLVPIRMDPAVVVDFLQSPNCHLTCLEVVSQDVSSLSQSHLAELQRAARSRNFWKLRVGQNDLARFLRALEIEKWFWVMIAVTSVHHIPRLRSEKCPLGMIPVGTFLPVIVETLGWPLNRLR